MNVTRACWSICERLYFRPTDYSEGYDDADDDVSLILIIIYDASRAVVDYRRRYVSDGIFFSTLTLLTSPSTTHHRSPIEFSGPHYFLFFFFSGSRRCFSSSFCILYIYIHTCIPIHGSVFGSFFAPFLSTHFTTPPHVDKLLRIIALVIYIYIYI